MRPIIPIKSVFELLQFYLIIVCKVVVIIILIQFKLTSQNN